MNNAQSFENLIKKFNLSDKSYKIIQLFYYHTKEWNPKLKLISHKNFEKNFFSLLQRCFQYAAFLYPYNSFIDVGSGGGFPSIPLKIFNPNSSAILIESSLKKSIFLVSLISNLGLKNTRLINLDFKRALFFLKKENITVDYITSIGIKKKENFIKALPLTNKGISFITGTNEIKRLQEIKYLKRLNWQIKKIHNTHHLYFVILSS